MRWVAENSMPKRAANPSSVALNGMPKKVGRGMPVMPFGPPVTRLPVDQHQADDLTERQRDDREIVAAQPQHRKAEQHAPERGKDAGERQADPERQVEGRRQQRVGIGADRVERHVAEVEQACEADDDVQSPAEHHVGQDQDAEVEHVALIVEDHRNDQREAEQGRADEAPDDRKRPFQRLRHEASQARDDGSCAAAVRPGCCRRTPRQRSRPVARTGSSRRAARSWRRPRCARRSSARTGRTRPAR